jgi:hypothetical protein
MCLPPFLPPAANISASGSLDLSLSKGQAAAAANPSTPPVTTADASSGVTVLSAPQVSVDLSIKKEKVPLLTVSDAPCKKICKDKCTITLEKHCLTVDVPKKDCNIEKKAITKQFCEKKCKPSLKLDLPEIKLPTLPKDTTNPNPSTPPAAVAQTETQASLLKLSKSAAVSASVGDATASVDASASLDVNGRRLQSLPKITDLDVVSWTLLLLLLLGVYQHCIARAVPGVCLSCLQTIMLGKSVQLVLTYHC